MSHYNPTKDGSQIGHTSMQDLDLTMPRGSMLRAARHRIELIGMAMTALAALLAGWSIYQASQWFGVSAMNYGNANLQLTTAVQAHMEADRQMVADLLQLQDWLRAERTGDIDTASFVEGQFSERFHRLFEKWRDGSPHRGLTSPANREGGRLVLSAAPEEPVDILAQTAKDAFLAAHQANLHGNDFLVAGILFGLGLLFGFCCIRMDTPMLQISALVCCELATLAGVALLLSVPAHFGL
ncbi:MAG: hypothetical protein FIA97_10535 [Methylococcaceae bacterium]|nr:hypothetical protein [Methylococcaceae bacterium]